MTYVVLARGKEGDYWESFSNKSEALDKHQELGQSGQWYSIHIIKGTFLWS